jgi:hypothetical protein
VELNIMKTLWEYLFPGWFFRLSEVDQLLPDCITLASAIHNLYWTDAFRSASDHHQCPTLMLVSVITVLYRSRTGLPDQFTFNRVYLIWF